MYPHKKSMFIMPLWAFVPEQIVIWAWDISIAIVIAYSTLPFTCTEKQGLAAA
jgi:hypothetical protein